MSQAEPSSTVPETPPAPASAEAAADAARVADATSRPAEKAASDTASAEGTQETAADTAAAETEQLRADLAAARQTAADNYDRYLRAVADLDSFRRRALREKDEARQLGAARLLEDLVPVLDTLGLARAAVEAPGADAKSLAAGVGMVIEQLRGALSQHGIKELRPTGQPFDPNLHEAISQQPSETVPEGHVITVVRAGYQLQNRLVRAASVVVSGGPAPAPASPAEGVVI